jgi:maltose O-acetyltransferase
MKKIYLMIYYLVARHLPSSDQIYSFYAKKIRAFLVKKIFKHTGKHVNIEHGVFFGKGDLISIGDYSGLGINARIQGPLTIGKHVIMGPDVLIYTRNHRFDDVTQPISVQGDIPPKEVVIHDDVWIGARVIILPGVTIGKGAIIGAGSVVTKNVREYCIYAGNPAKLIKERR